LHGALVGDVDGQRAGQAAALQAAEAARQPAITVMRIIFFIVVSECLVQTAMSWIFQVLLGSR
jgi:hypothetical protein